MTTTQQETAEAENTARLETIPVTGLDAIDMSAFDQVAVLSMPVKPVVTLEIERVTPKQIIAANKSGMASDYQPASKRKERHHLSLKRRRAQASHRVREVMFTHVSKLGHKEVTDLLTARDPREIMLAAKQAKCTIAQFHLALDVAALIRMETSDTLGQGSLVL